MAMKNSSHLVEILSTTERRPHSKIVITVEFRVFSSTHWLNPLRLFGYQMSLKTVAGWQLWLTSPAVSTDYSQKHAAAQSDWKEAAESAGQQNSAC